MSDYNRVVIEKVENGYTVQNINYNYRYDGSFVFVNEDDAVAKAREILNQKQEQPATAEAPVASA